ncbi:MAG: endolytic transglycosylase MltG [Myxococcota bacterium]
MRRLILLALALGLAGATGGALFVRSLLAPVAEPGAASEIFVVERGASLGRVAWQLEQQGLIRDGRAFRWWAHWRGDASRLKAGEYGLDPGLGSDEILSRLTRGQVMTHEVVIPEGTRASEIAARLESRGLATAEAFLAAATDPALADELGVPGDTLEGYLYPETYRLPRGLAPREIARAMVAQFRQAWSEVEPRAVERGMSMHDVVTLASIVEKETAAPEERPLIAAVFLNRLDRGMRLETDPTVIYGIPDFDGNLKKRHLLDDGNPYNTYRHAGLPPGPIASPGADALRAVVSPAESDYLFFVSRNDGTHKFSRTHREHVNAVNRYQKRRRSK